jgi:hypothetical protein
MLVHDLQSFLALSMSRAVCSDSIYFEVELTARRRKINDPYQVESDQVHSEHLLRASQAVTG